MRAVSDLFLNLDIGSLLHAWDDHEPMINVLQKKSAENKSRFFIVFFTNSVLLSVPFTDAH